MRIGVYPGSFNPPTVAHLAVARAAVEQCGLDRIDLIISRRTLGKHGDDLMAIDDRLAALRPLTRTFPWLSSTVTDEQLIADIAHGYDVVVVGADKWAQVVDPAWYGGSEVERDRAVGRLPHVAVAPRPPDSLPPRAPNLTILDIEVTFHTVSSTGAREGRSEWLLLPPGARSGQAGEAEDGMA